MQSVSLTGFDCKCSYLGLPCRLESSTLASRCSTLIATYRHEGIRLRFFGRPGICHPVDRCCGRRRSLPIWGPYPEALGLAKGGADRRGQPRSEQIRESEKHQEDAPEEEETSGASECDSVAHSCKASDLHQLPDRKSTQTSWPSSLNRAKPPVLQRGPSANEEPLQVHVRGSP